MEHTHLRIGEPVNSFRNYKLDGVWQIGEEADAAVFSRRPGDLKVNVPGMTRLAPGVYVKTAANGTQTYYYNNLADAQKYNPALTAATSRYNYSANDYQILGHNTPDWSLGFQNGFKYKSFDLTIYVIFQMGANDQLRYAGMVSAAGICNQCKSLKNIS